MSKPFKGIFQDCNLVDQPEGFYRNSQNVIYNKLKDSICNEGGFGEIDSLPSGAIFNGSVRLEMSTIVIYTLNNFVHFDEFKNGLLGNTLFGVSNLILKLDPNYPVRGIYYNNNKGERLIVIIDGLNSPKLINLDINLEITTNNSYLIELFPKGKVPLFDTITINNSGGSLLTGSYAFAINYVFDDDSETNYFNISDFISIFRNSNNTSNNLFVGNEVEVVTSKSILINLTNLDISYKKLNVAIIKYSSGNIFVNKVTYNYNTTTKTIVITGNENSESLLFEEIITKRTGYDSANAITYSNKKLYLANLNKVSFPDYRPYAANITSKWVFNEYANLETVEGSHKDPNTIYLKRSFMPDEVYAFWIAFNLKDGTQSPAFHIPGREATTFNLNGNNYFENTSISDIVANDPTQSDLEEDITIDSNIRYFHTRDTATSDNTMAYWENENEVYDSNYSDLEGEKVRHHKFPSLNQLLNWYYNPTTYDSNINFSVTAGSSDFSDFVIIGPKYSIIGEVTIDIDDPLVTGFIKVEEKDIFDNVIYTVNETYYNYLDSYLPYAILNRVPKINTYKVSITISLENGSDYNSLDFTGTFKNYSYNNNLLGIRFDNIEIPQEIKNISSGYEIFYTKRFESNSTIVGQSLLFRFEEEDANVISDIYNNKEFAIHPPDLLKNQEYPGVNPNFIKNENVIKSINNINYRKAKNQIYLPSDINSSNKIRRIENVEYFSYSNEFKKETCIKGIMPVSLSFSDNGIISNLCNYIPDVYVDSTFLVSTGKVFNLDISDTSDLYKGDVYLTEYSLRCLPEYENEFGEVDFGRRKKYGTYSIYVYNRSNTGLRLKGENFGELFYPLKNIINSPPLNTFFSDVWGGATLENETPDHFDNYLMINNDLYKRNDINAVQPKENTDEIEYYPNLIIQSESVQYGSKGGNIRTFLPTNYYEMPRNKGKIINLESKGKDVIIHLEDSIYVTVSEVNLDPTQVNITLGSGKIFDIDPNEIIPVTGGYAGTQHWTSCFMTKAGYFFVDNRRKKIFLMSDTLEEISNYGMKTFFEENLDFEINKQLINVNKTPLTANNPNYRYGIGYVVGFDDRYNRILFTKRDFKVHSVYSDTLMVTNNIVYTINNVPLSPESSLTLVENKSFTLSYSLETKSWISFHTYYPQWWLYNYNIPFTFFKGNNINSSIYSFNEDFKNGIYYTNIPQQSYIEFVFNEQSTINKLLENVSWESTYIRDDLSIDGFQTFNKIQITNSYQDTEIIDLKIASNYRDSSANLAKKTGIWNFNKIVTPNISYKQQNRFIDKYNNICLINTNEEPNILYLSNIDVRQRFSQF